MKIVFLTRTSRPSGALVAERLLKDKKNLVAIIAEERAQLLKKGGNTYSLFIDSIKRHGLRFTKDRLLEWFDIKLHFLLRRLLGSKIYRSKRYLSIEELALDYNTPYFVVDNHNSKKTEELIRSFSPDLMVITNTRLLRNNIISIPKAGCLNLHLSKLPKYAGLDAIFWALFYGEREVGVTVHYVSKELDRGDIILQKDIPVLRYDNEKILYRKATGLGAEMMSAAVVQIEQDKICAIKQDGVISCFGWPRREQRCLLRRRLKRRRKIKRDGPIKVLHIITRLVRGGAQENTLSTVLGLRDKGYDVMLVSGPTYGPEGEIESYARAMGVNLVIIPELARTVNPVKDLISLIKLFNLIRKEHFDIVHTHTSKAGIIGRWAAKLSGVMVIVHTPHGHIFHSYFGPARTAFFRILEVISASFCDRIITLTDQCKEEHIKLKIAHAEKFVTIHSGVKLERFLNRSFDIGKIKKELNIPDNRKVIGTVARLEPVKGVYFLIEAMCEVLKHLAGIHLLIVGDGSQRKHLEEKTKASGMANNVTFSGIREDIPELISVMDLFVLSSLNEGMGRVLVQAGVMAKPIVATRVSGIPELIIDGSTGVLVEPRNTKDLARGIMELLSDPDKARALGENARRSMADNFGVQAMIEKIENLYKKLLFCEEVTGRWKVS